MNARNWRYVGIGATVFGIIMLNQGQDFGVSLVLGGVVMIVTSYFRKRKTKKKKKSDFVLTDDMISRLALMKGGVLSVQDLTTQTSLTTEQAKERLEQLHLSNKAELRITDLGNLIYDFRENYELPEDKYNSKLILD